VALAVASTLALAGPAQAAVSVQALWNMDSLPTMVDSAGGDNNGSTKNVTLSGGAYSFNGKTSLATVPDKANLDPGSATIKLTARVSFAKAPAVGGTFDIVRKGLTTSAGGDYKIEIIGRSGGVGVAGCTFKDANGVAVHSYGTVNLVGKGFQTITCTKTSSSVQLVAGGQTRTTSVKNFGSISNSAPVYVGGKGDGTDAFPGLIDLVKISIG
jgi:hypothetical protein